MPGVVPVHGGLGFEADGIGQRHHTDRGTVARGRARGRSHPPRGRTGWRGPCGPADIRGCRPQIQGADDGFRRVERACCLSDPAPHVQPGLTGGSLALIGRQVGTAPCLVGELVADPGDMAGQERKAARVADGPHRGVLRAVTAGQVEIANGGADPKGETFRDQSAGFGVIVGAGASSDGQRPGRRDGGLCCG